MSYAKPRKPRKTITTAIIKPIVQFSTYLTTALIALIMTLPTQSFSEVPTDLPIDHSLISWRQLPPAIQQYYQSDKVVNPLALSREDIVSIHTWYDADGSNYLILLQRVVNKAHSEFATATVAEVIAHRYTLNEDKAERVWQVFDHIEPCGLDWVAQFSSPPFSLTDLNQNGITEVSLPYYLGCFGDISYYQMKIIMYEGQQKFAIRGNSALCDGKTGRPVRPDRDYGGENTIDDRLLQQSPLSARDKSLFKRHLESLWQKHQCTTYFHYD